MDREKTIPQYTCSRRKNKSIITIINNKTMKPFDIEKAKNNIGDSKDYIATVPIEWEE